MVSSNQLKGVDNLATTKNITMKQFNGTDYDTLYPKTIASQIPDVYSKTDTITAETLSRLGLGADKLPNDAFQQIKTLTDSKARIQTGRYVGTGTYGPDNPCSLTFEFEPKFVFVFGKAATLSFNEFAIGHGGYTYGSLNGNTATWYINGAGSGLNKPQLQLNASGVTYGWVAIV